MSKIRWDDDEKARLGTAALPLLIADQKLSIVDAIRRVQDTVLPEARRRNLSNVGMVPTDLRATLDQRRDAATGKSTMVDDALYRDALERATNAETAAKAADGEVERLQTVVKNLESHIRTLEAHPAPTEIEVLGNFCARVLADALAKGKELTGVRMERDVRPPPLVEQPAPVRTNGNGNGNGKHDPHPVQLPRDRLPILLICGLEPPERTFYESTFGKEIRLKWWTEEAGAHRLKEKAMACDMAFMIMGRCHHASVAIASRDAPEYQRIPTYSRDAIKDMIDGWYRRVIKPS